MLMPIVQLIEQRPQSEQRPNSESTQAAAISLSKDLAPTSPGKAPAFSWSNRWNPLEKGRNGDAEELRPGLLFFHILDIALYLYYC